MRIVVVADTHRLDADGLPDQLVDALQQADMIAHLGDFTGVEIADFLEEQAPLVAVHGNCDELAIRHRYPEMRRIHIADYQLVLLHGHVGGRTALASAERVDDADIVLYGHSHVPRIDQRGERLLFNPGSPTQRRFAPHRTFGTLDIGERVVPTLVTISNG